MGDPGYFEREARHDETTARMRKEAKDGVSFYLAIDALRKEGIEFPENIQFSFDHMKLDKTLEDIGTIITKAKGLTIDDASPKMKKAVLKDTKEIRDMNIGWEYFTKIQEEQKKRVLDKDVEHISYYSHYGKGIDIMEIVEKVKARESQSALVKGSKGKDITD